MVHKNIYYKCWPECLKIHLNELKVIRKTCYSCGKSEYLSSVCWLCKIITNQVPTMLKVKIYQKVLRTVKKTRRNSFQVFFRTNQIKTIRKNN